MTGPVLTIECLTCDVRFYGDPTGLTATMNTEHAGHRWGPVRRATTREVVVLVMGGTA